MFDERLTGLLERFVRAYEHGLELDTANSKANREYKAAQNKAVESLVGFLKEQFDRQKARDDEYAKERSTFAGENLEGTFRQLNFLTGASGSPLIPLDNVHEDARGYIHNLIASPVGSVAVISSKANTVRANHWHKDDGHLCYVVSGAIEYYERPVGSQEAPKTFVYKAGEQFYTGPNLEHAMKFLEDTVFVTIGKHSRKQADYESDLVRLEKPLA